MDVHGERANKYTSMNDEQFDSYKEGVMMVLRLVELANIPSKKKLDIMTQAQIDLELKQAEQQKCEPTAR